MKVKRVKFEMEDLENAMSSLSDSEIDNLMFGAIELDAEGTILRYNIAESELTGDAVDVSAQ